MRTMTRTNSTAQAPAMAPTWSSLPWRRWTISRAGATRAAAPMASSRPRPRRASRRWAGSDSPAIDGCSPEAPSNRYAARYMPSVTATEAPLRVRAENSVSAAKVTARLAISSR